MGVKNIRNVDFDEVLGRIKRLKNLRFDYQVAAILGITKQNLAERKTRTSLPFDKLQLFCEKEFINYDWLLTGEGEMSKKPPVPEALPTAMIPVLGRVPAGFPENVSEEVLEYISLPSAPPGSYALIVKGESMSPGIRDGDYVLFVPDGDYKNGDVIVVNNEFGDSMIKRYRIKPEGEVWLFSDNPEYPSFKPNEQYRIIGKVVRAWREIKF